MTHLRALAPRLVTHAHGQVARLRTEGMLGRLQEELKRLRDFEVSPVLALKDRCVLLLTGPTSSIAIDMKLSLEHLLSSIKRTHARGKWRALFPGIDFNPIEVCDFQLNPRQTSKTNYKEATRLTFVTRTGIEN